jgi:uncharacterized SAM-binding protein YcdF (DUF218 family)
LSIVVELTDWMVVKTFLKEMLLPPAGPLLLALLGVALVKRRPLFGRALVVLGVAMLWLLATPVISNAIVDLTQHYPAFDADARTDAAAIVILGGGGQRFYAPEYQGPAADPLLLERLAYGAFLARKTSLPILVTGFHIEATAMHDSLRQLFGIEPRWVDDQAFDTFQNAQDAARLLAADGIHKVLLVTHSTHMWRAVHEFAGAGLQVIPAPLGIRIDREAGLSAYLPSAAALLRSYSAVYELLGEPFRALLAWLHLRGQPSSVTGSGV